MLTEQDKADRSALKALFDKRAVRQETKEGFFYFENQQLMIAEGQETYVIVAHDMAIGFPLFMTGESDFAKFDLAISLLHERGWRIDTVWDVGANIGSICIPAVKRNLVKRAVAFEPEKRLFRILRANTILNAVEDRIECHNVALGASAGTVELTIGANNTGDYRVAGRQFEDDAMGEALRQRQVVDVRPMDDFCDGFEESKTVIFMDIQGYEGIALQGGRSILSSSPPLVVEFWPYAMKRLGSFAAMRDLAESGIYKQYADLAEGNAHFQPLTPKALDELYLKIGEAAASSTDLLCI